MNILIADDNVNNQKLLLKVCVKLGCEATVVDNGLMALELYKKNYKKNKYDLILLDCSMPEMDGFEACKQIREFEKSNNHHVKIIAMTGYSSDADQKKCVAAGMDEVITKPVDIASLMSIIKNQS